MNPGAWSGLFIPSGVAAARIVLNGCWKIAARAGLAAVAENNRLSFLARVETKLTIMAG